VEGAGERWAIALVEGVNHPIIEVNAMIIVIDDLTHKVKIDRVGRTTSVHLEDIDLIDRLTDGS
jgi:hypothetical protein